MEQLNVIRDGTFFTNQFCGKYDASKSTLCLSCGVLDSREHRYTVCSKYDSVRAEHQDLFAIWDELPVCFKLQGLVPANPWQELLWEAYQALPNLANQYELQPTGGTWHLFTDGTCNAFADPANPLAAWSVVWAEHGTISCGYLPGIQQTIFRAETMAIVSALGWVQQREGVLHLWIDSQSVLDCLRDLLQGTGDASKFDHTDLWKEIETSLNVARAEIVPHKVVSHLPLAECQGPLEEWTREWNKAADEQADLANMTRPNFFTRARTRFQKYRTDWKNRVKLITSFHLAIAAQDCTGEVHHTHEDDHEFEFSHFDFVTSQNTAAVSVHLSTWHETGVFCTRLGSAADHILAQFGHWIQSVDASASEMRLVSVLEIFVAFRVFRWPASVC